MPSKTNLPTAGPSKSQWKRIETWLFLIIMIGCGFVAGWSVSQYFVWKEANKQFKELSNSYSAAAQTRRDILQRCLSQTQVAANEAADSATQTRAIINRAITKEAAK